MEVESQVALQESVRAVCLENPDWAGYLQQMVDYETTHPYTETWNGWLWQDVRTPPSTINRLIVVGLVSMNVQTRKFTNYRLVSLADTREALEMLRVVPQPTPNGPVTTESLFRLVVGHEKAKLLLTYALQADQPIHVLLVGPPGTAKTLLLSDIGQLAGAKFYAGSTTTKAGLVGLLLRDQPKYLVLDELDKMAESDMTPLLNLMEGGVVTRLQFNRAERLSLPTKVFASANDLGHLSEPIKSRFLKIEVPAYSAAEFITVAQGVLVAREGLGQQTALLVANEVVRYSTDIRDAVRVGRLGAKRPQDIPLIVRAMFEVARKDRLLALPGKDGGR